MFFFISMAPLLMAFVTTQNAYAQRGATFALPNTQSPPQTPNDGFPGFFDTNLAKPESLVLDIPTFNFDYGVNERLTIGANSLGALLMLTTFSPAIVGKARYRLFSTGNFVDTLTFYGGFAKSKETEKNAAANYFAAVFTNNFCYFFSSESQLYTSVLVGRLDYTKSSLSKTDYEKKGVNPVIVSLGYQHFFMDFIGVSPLLIYNFYTKMDSDNASTSVNSSNSISAVTSNLLLRATLDIKIGNSFLLSAYLVATHVDNTGSSNPFTSFSTMPWASFMYRW